jgi:2-amino-4-hydroxy-6-hydroxymethyldihydropteridine diphosphokinase
MKYLLIGLGSNINPQLNLVAALAKIEQHINVLQHSSILINPPCGDTFHFSFHNQILLASTDKSLKKLKQRFEEIEIELGREAKTPARKFTDRTIDIDILKHYSSVFDLCASSFSEKYNQEIMTRWSLLEKVSALSI